MSQGSTPLRHFFVELSYLAVNAKSQYTHRLQRKRNGPRSLLSDLISLWLFHRGDPTANYLG